MTSYYSIFLALHVVAVISWMAGILYLYRLLIYYKERAGSSSDNKELLALMGRRLYVFITKPAMVVAWLMAILMVSIQPHLLGNHWFQVKLACALLLTASTGIAGIWALKIYKEVPITLPSSKALRYLNEVPTVLMIVIVFMVITKPF